MIILIAVRVLLLSTYELGRQPFGLASPAAWLRREGFDVDVVDTSRGPIDDAALARAALVGVHLQMHTATRLAGPLIARVRRVNPKAHVCCFGLYAPLNGEWLQAEGVGSILGGEYEADLVTLAAHLAKGQRPPAAATGVSRLRFIQPDRRGLPPLTAYARVEMPDGSRRVAGATDASRGCKHLCRHCPIVPVYQGRFRVVPVDVVMADITAQVAAGAAHISFGDPDFFNGPAHAMAIVERLAREHPGVSYDVTIKVEHLLRHAQLLPRLRDTGCLFVTSAVEAVDDAVLEKLDKGHTRADVERAAGLCRGAGLPMAPTFVPFTPWTSVSGYLDLIDTIARLDLVGHVAPIQLAIRLLVTARSALLDLPDVRSRLQPFDPSSLTWPWQHDDPRVDALQRRIMDAVSETRHAPRAVAFDVIARLAAEAAGLPPDAAPSVRNPVAAVPRLNEPWYCCAEPDAEMGV